MKPSSHNLKKIISHQVAGFNGKLNGHDTGKKKKIMVADDDPAIIDVLTLMLEDAGYKVYTSANGETVSDVTRICPDLLLLDVLMSGINGSDICKELKSQPLTMHIPVIMISANKEAREITAEACADDFISKPFEMDELLKKVATYV